MCVCVCVCVCARACASMTGPPGLGGSRVEGGGGGGDSEGRQPPVSTGRVGRRDCVNH